MMTRGDESRAGLGELEVRRIIYENVYSDDDENESR